MCTHVLRNGLRARLRARQDRPARPYFVPYIRSPASPSPGTI